MFSQHMRDVKTTTKVSRLRLNSIPMCFSTLTNVMSPEINWPPAEVYNESHFLGGGDFKRHWPQVLWQNIKQRTAACFMEPSLNRAAIHKVGDIYHKPSRSHKWGLTLPSGLAKLVIEWLSPPVKERFCFTWKAVCFRSGTFLLYTVKWEIFISIHCIYIVKKNMIKAAVIERWCIKNGL